MHHKNLLIGITAVLLTLILIYPLLIHTSHEEAVTVPTSPNLPEDALPIGASGYFCVTGVSDAVDAIGTDGTRRVQVFAHRIYDPEGEYIVTLTSTVVGIHSQEEDTASILEITGQLTDAAAEGFDLSNHISKNTATAVLYWNCQSVCHIQYRLYPNGTIDIL